MVVGDGLLAWFGWEGPSVGQGDDGSGSEISDGLAERGFGVGCDVVLFFGPDEEDEVVDVVNELVDVSFIQGVPLVDELGVTEPTFDFVDDVCQILLEKVLVLHYIRVKKLRINFLFILKGTILHLLVSPLKFNLG